jgi:hypothetical protein
VRPRDRQVRTERNAPPLPYLRPRYPNQDADRNCHYGQGARLGPLPHQQPIVPPVRLLEDIPDDEDHESRLEEVESRLDEVVESTADSAVSGGYCVGPRWPTVLSWDANHAVKGAAVHGLLSCAKTRWAVGTEFRLQTALVKTNLTVS